MFTEPDIQVLLDNLMELIIFKNISDPVSGHKTKKEKWQSACIRNITLSPN